MKFSTYLAASCAAVSLAATFAAPAFAQANGATEASADNAASGDIIVTARRRDERLQDVPIAVTAISGADLATKGITDTQSLNFATPSLQIAASAFGPSVPGYAIRGQRLIEQILPVDPSVGVYFADVVQQRPHGTNQILYDLESVQVLKGPQGTLFGRNTTGGAILITPAKPVLGVTNARISGTYGNYDLHGAEAMLNLSNSDTFGIRIAGKVRYHDGYGENILNGRELNDQNMETFRVGLLWEPAPGISSYTVGSYFNQKDHGYLFTPVNLNQASTLRFFPGLLNPANAALARQRQRSVYDVEYDGPTFDHTETYSVSNTTSFEISDAATIKNIIGYRHVFNDVAFDYDGLPVPIFHTADTLRAKQISEELQLLGNAMDNRLSYIVGGYYFRESGYDFQVSRSFGGRGASREGYAINKSYSVFAQADYKFTDQFTLTAGLRQTWDDRSFDNRARKSPAVGNPAPDLSICRLETDNVNLIVLPIDQCSRLVTANFNKLTYLITLSYKPNRDMLFYASHSTGYRSGGIPFRGVKPRESQPFAPENARNYELGAKLDLFDRMLTINTAAYYTDYKDIQRTLQQQCPGAPPGTSLLCVTIENAASARIKGVELEVNARPTSWLTLSGFYGYTDAKYKSFIIPLTGQDFSGNRFAFVPKQSWGVGGNLHVPVGDDSEVSASLNFYHQAKMQGADVNDTDPIPGYGVLNGTIGWTNVSGSGIDALFFMNNITDNVYANSSIDNFASNSFGTNGYAYADPRTYGLTLTVHLGDR